MGDNMPKRRLLEDAEQALRSAKSLALKADSESATKRSIIPIAVYLIYKDTLRIMSCTLLVIVYCSYQNCTFIVGIKRQLFDPAHPCFVNRQSELGTEFNR